MRIDGASCRIDGTGFGLNLHSYWSRCCNSFRSHIEVKVSWCLNGPLKAAFIADRLNAQIADPCMLFLYSQKKRKRNELNIYRVIWIGQCMHKWTKLTPALWTLHTKCFLHLNTERLEFRQNKTDNRRATNNLNVLWQMTSNYHGCHDGHLDPICRHVRCANK